VQAREKPAQLISAEPDEMAQSHNNAPNEARSIQVLVRFCLRIIVLSVFATLGSVGFGKSSAALLWLSAILCVVGGILRRELPFGSALTHWDEGATYGALYCLASPSIRRPDAGRAFARTHCGGESL